MSGILVWIVFAPLLGALAVLVLPTALQMKRAAAAASGVALLLSLFLLTPYAAETSGSAPGHTDFRVRVPWISTADGAFQVQFDLGVDGLSTPFVILTALISLLALVASWDFERWPGSRGLRGYLALLLILETGILGVFTALDFFLFYIFFEVMLVPMYFLIGIWGGSRKEYAALKFFLYTLAGSVLLLIVMLALYFYVPPGLRTFDLLELARNSEIQRIFRNDQTLFLGFRFETIMFVLAFIGFAIKIPMVPFHTWLPDAHVEAPTPISMILAGLLLKTGGYGLLRIVYPIFPEAATQFAVALSTLGVVCILYGALCTLAQTDLKRLVAYSSVSHMGYVVLGIAALNQASMQGAVFQMIAHGISSAMCFYLVGVLYQRAGHREIGRFGGIWMRMPTFGALATIGFFATMGLPALCGFVGEVMVVLGTFDARNGALGAAAYPLGILAATGALFAAAYILWMMQRVFLGPARPDSTAFLDTDRREIGILAPLAALAVFLGVLPQQTVLNFIGGAVTDILRLASP